MWVIINSIKGEGVNKLTPLVFIQPFSLRKTMQKDYYFAVCSYNVEFAQLIAKMGMSLKDFHTIYMNQ